MRSSEQSAAPSGTGGEQPPAQALPRRGSGGHRANRALLAGLATLAVRVADSVFVVRASVDSRGVAGAPMRVPFRCRVRWLGADRWLEEGTDVQTP